MPTTRHRIRRPLGGPSAYPPAVAAVARGEPVLVETEQARRELVAAAYFGWADGLPPELCEACRSVLDMWRPALSLDDD